MRALFIGNITLDILNNGVRVGGTGFYGGRALSEYLGVETYVLSHISRSHRELVLSTLGNYGIRVIELEAEHMPMFIIKNGKAVQFQGSSPKIPKEIVEKHIRLSKFDIIVLAPIMRELDVDTIELLNKHKNSVISMDIQGFVRTVAGGKILCEWSNTLERALAYMDIVHGNIAEFCFSINEKNIVRYIAGISTVYRTAFLISLDYRGTYMVYKGDILYIPPLTVNIIDDVGAGDILLAITSYFKAKGEPLLYAVVKGVIAASLKVENAYRSWFNKELLEELMQDHLNKVQAVNL